MSEKTRNKMEEGRKELSLAKTLLVRLNLNRAIQWATDKKDPDLKKEEKEILKELLVLAKKNPVIAKIMNTILKRDSQNSSEYRQICQIISEIIDKIEKVL